MRKKIIVFGATGGTGQQILKQAIEQEQKYDISIFVRNPLKLNLPTGGLNVVIGDVLNFEQVRNAIRDQEIVLCCLGAPASHKTTLRADGTANIIKAMEELNVKRLICQTSLGFGDSEGVLPWHMKYIIVPFILKNAFKDHALQEERITESKLDWTIVRPGNMTNGKKLGRFKHGFESNAKIKLKISRADVAEFMLRQIDQLNYMYQKVGISY